MTAPRRETFVERAADRLFVGTGSEAPFLIRHDWVLPVAIFAGCGVFSAIVVWLSIVDWGRPILVTGGIVLGVVFVASMATMFIVLHRATRGPLPALDRTPRTARVILSAPDSEGHTLLLRYTGADGDQHHAQLADYPAPDWIDAFSPGSTWQVYAFRDPELADSVVFLTETHDDVWRAGYVLDGVRIGGESGPLRAAPGSPFLRGNGKWEFES